MFLRNVTQDSILKTPLWYNNDIQVGNNYVFYPNWFKAAIFTVNDLVKNTDDMTFYSFDEFLQNFRINTNFLQYHGVVTAVKRFLQKYNFQMKRLAQPFLPHLLEIFFMNKKGSKDFYKCLISPPPTPNGIKKWNEYFDFEFDNEKWQKILKIPFSVTKSSKLQWFQVRIIHHILITNTFLYKTKLYPSPLCSLCNKERETIIHCIWECCEVQKLLQQFENLCDILFIPVVLNKESFLFGLLSPVANIVDNEIIILIKHYIYKSRCLHKPLSLDALINTIKDHFNTVKFTTYYKNENIKRKFDNNWRKWKHFIEM